MLELAAMPIPAADAVLLIECLYYLAPAERNALVKTVQHGHPNATVIVATPTTGGDYFTESELRRLFAAYDLVGVEATHWRSIYRAALGEICRGRMRTDGPFARTMRNGLADHAIYAFR
jgi:hypothetical protein